MLTDFPYGDVKKLREGCQNVQANFPVVILDEHFPDQRGGYIDAELLLERPRNAGIVQFDSAKLIFKRFLPFYEPLFDEAGIGVVRVVDILCDRIGLLISAHFFPF